MQLPSNPEAEHSLGGTWRVLSATARGASHEVSNMPNQDAEQSARLRGLHEGAFVVAVSDGHGNRRHFRSERGSRFAVEVACQCSEDLEDRLRTLDDASSAERFALTTLVPTIIGRWIAAVDADVERDPITLGDAYAEEAASDAPVVAYGSTLIVAVAWGQWVVLAQIGDGDVLALTVDGKAFSPVPKDPALDGLRTTSLCQPNALDSFRVAVIDRSACALVGLLIATDGFANAQAADPWEPAVGSDLVEMIRTRGVRWVEGQLPEWVARCASSDGSADDTTVALLVEGAHHD